MQVAHELAAVADIECEKECELHVGARVEKRQVCPALVHAEDVTVREAAAGSKLQKSL